MLYSPPPILVWKWGEEECARRKWEKGRGVNGVRKWERNRWGKEGGEDMAGKGQSREMQGKESKKLGEREKEEGKEGIGVEQGRG